MLTFDKPPVAEVAIGRVFVPMPDFLVPHFGQFWAEIRDEYPNVQHAPSLVDGIPVQDVNGAWLPRIWFVSRDGTRMLQLQQDRMYFNWRKVGAASEYVRFKAIEAEFTRLSALFNKFVVETLNREVQAVRLELTYVNVIPSGEHWTDASNVSNVLRDFYWHTGKSVLPTPTSFQSQWDIALPKESGQLVVKVARVRKEGTPAIDALKLELAAIGKASASMNEAQWFSDAHDQIVLGFKDLTTDAMHRVWRLQE